MTWKIKTPTSKPMPRPRDLEPGDWFIDPKGVLCQRSRNTVIVFGAKDHEHPVFDVIGLESTAVAEVVPYGTVLEIVV